jgi:hypothetical protein
MWTGQLISQAIGWLALICGSPFIFIYLRKVVSYIAYKLFPKDMILQYESNGVVTEAFYIKQSMFKVRSFRRLSAEELRSIGDANEK